MWQVYESLQTCGVGAAGNQFVGDTVNSDLRQMMLTFDTNFWGSIRVLQAALPLMPTSGTASVSFSTV